MATKMIFVSYDYDNDKHYKSMLLAWSRNTEFDFYMNDQSTDVSIDSTDAGAIKRVISARINGATYFLCLVGKSTHKSKWVAYEVAKAVELKKRLVGVKIEKDNAPPAGLLNQGATWALSFTFEGIKKAIDAA